MNGESEFWKWATDLMMVFIGGGLAFIWRMVHGRPTFTQVKDMISEHERGSCYARDQKWIAQEFTGLKAKLLEIGRHVDDTREKVERIDMAVQIYRRQFAGESGESQ